jgi:arsenate reductase
MAKRKILFLCTGNSCRSQMAEGFLRHLASEVFDARSAGINPKGLNPDAVSVMREVGIDISGQRSKHAEEFFKEHFPYVITVCDNAKESCPVFPGAVKYLHWSLEDPAAAQGTQDERLKVFRRVRDKIHQHVLGLIEEIRSARLPAH